MSGGLSAPHPDLQQPAASIHPNGNSTDSVAGRAGRHQVNRLRRAADHQRRTDEADKTRLGSIGRRRFYRVPPVPQAHWLSR